MYTITDNSADTLAQAVRQARIRLGLTQQGLALACGLSRQTIAQVESGSFSDLGVRKVWRMLAVLGLSLNIGAAGHAQNPAGIARVRGAGAGSRFGRLLAAKSLERRRRALGLAGGTLDALREAGVSAQIVGSLVKGKFRADSDVDYLVENRGGLPESTVVSIVESSMDGFPFDIVFADRADPGLLAMMREEARRGAPPVRAA